MLLDILRSIERGGICVCRPVWSERKSVLKTDVISYFWWENSLQGGSLICEGSQEIETRPIHSLNEILLEGFLLGRTTKFSIDELEYHLSVVATKTKPMDANTSSLYFKKTSSHIRRADARRTAILRLSSQTEKF